MRFRPLTLVLAGALVALPAAAAPNDALHGPVSSPAGEDLQAYVEGASRLEGRLLAPCCWNQTLDIHGSEPSTELRREIRRRLKAGETADAVEASIVQRYGQKILAVPTGSPLGAMAAMLAVLFGGAGVAGYFMLKRWTKRGRETRAAAKPPSTRRDGMDERLDKELAEIGE